MACLPITPTKPRKVHVGQRVTITPLTDHQQQLAATIVHRSGHVLFLKTSAPLNVGGAAQISVPNGILLAEVLSRHPSADGYAIVIAVEHALRNVNQYFGRFWPEIKSASAVENSTRQYTRMQSDSCAGAADAQSRTFRMCATVWCFTASLVLELLSQALGRR